MSEEPTMPPNLPFFQRDRDGDMNFLCEFDGLLVWQKIAALLCGKRADYWRGIIAAAARCAWLDEARRLEIPLTQAPHYAAWRHPHEGSGALAGKGGMGRP